MVVSPAKERPNRPPNIRRPSSPIEVPRQHNRRPPSPAASGGSGNGSGGSQEKVRTLSLGDSRSISPSGETKAPATPKTQLLNSVMGALEAFGSDKEQSAKEDGDGYSSSELALPRGGTGGGGGPGLPRPPLSSRAKWATKYSSMSDSDDGMEREERRLNEQVRALNKRLNKQVPWPLSTSAKSSGDAAAATGGGGATASSTFNGEPASPPGTTNTNPLFIPHPGLDIYGINEAIPIHQDHTQHHRNISLASSTCSEDEIEGLEEQYVTANQIRAESSMSAADGNQIAGTGDMDLTFQTALTSISGADTLPLQGSSGREGGAGGRKAGKGGKALTVGRGDPSTLPFVGGNIVDLLLERREKQQQQQAGRRGGSADGGLDLSRSGQTGGGGGTGRRQSRGASVDGNGPGSIIDKRAAGSSNIVVANSQGAEQANVINQDHHPKSNNSNNKIMSSSTTTPMVVLEPAHLEIAIRKAVEMGRRTAAMSPSTVPAATATTAADNENTLQQQQYHKYPKDFHPSTPQLSEEELLAMIPSRLSRRKVWLVAGLVFIILVLGAVAGFVAGRMTQQNAKNEGERQAQEMHRRVLVSRVRPLTALIDDAIHNNNEGGGAQQRDHPRPIGPLGGLPGAKGLAAAAAAGKHKNIHNKNKDPCDDIPLVKIFWGRLKRAYGDGKKRRHKRVKEGKLAFPFDV